MHRLLRAIAFLILLGPALRAQENLIKNPSLEIMNDSIFGPQGVWFSVEDWGDIGSPDLFSEHETPTQVPQNYMGFQHPQEGANYFGSGFAISPRKPLEQQYTVGNEMVTIALKKALSPRKKYRFSFYVSLAELSVGVLDSFILVPFTFNPSIERYNTSSFPSRFFREQYESNLILGAMHADTANWTEISFIFQPKVRATYLYFGPNCRLSNFHLTQPLPPYATEGSGWTVLTYHYFDSFSLFEIPDTSLFLELPNTFTPNADGQNDEWHPRSRNFNHFELQVFNRYGTLVFQSQGEQVHWDGLTLSGEPAAEGVYFVHLVATDRYGEVHNEQETVHLFR